MRLEFDVEVTLRCTAGKVGCKARLALAPPEPAAKLKTRFLPRDGLIDPAGAAGWSRPSTSCSCSTGAVSSTKRKSQLVAKV